MGEDEWEKGWLDKWTDIDREMKRWMDGWTTSSCPKGILIVAMYWVLSRSNVLYIRAGHVLPMHCLHDASITHHASHREGVK